MKKYSIYLDFDGTCVEFAYPGIGRCNFGCIEVIHKLQNAGHEIILNTMRCEFGDGTLEKAIAWFDNAWAMLKSGKANYDMELKAMSHTTTKYHPGPWDWEWFKKNGFIIIDDQSANVPLKPAVMSKGQMVDWDEIDRQFIEHGIY